MKQYAVIYKSNRMPLAFYCTEEAALARLEFLTDSNAFGVYEANVLIHSKVKSDRTLYDNTLGLVCNLNKSLLSVHMGTSTAFKHTAAIKAGLFSVHEVTYDLGKEIKRPKKEEEVE